MMGYQQIEIPVRVVRPGDHYDSYLWIEADGQIRFGVPGVVAGGLDQMHEIELVNLLLAHLGLDQRVSVETTVRLKPVTV